MKRLVAPPPAEREVLGAKDTTLAQHGRTGAGRPFRYLALVYQTSFIVQTRGPGITDVTRDVAAWVSTTGVAAGLLTLFLRHTSASLVIQENADPAVRADLMNFLRSLVPPADDPKQGWITHRSEGSDDMPAHIKAALLPVSLQIPVAKGRMTLGTWQGICLWEHRARPHTREIVGHLA